MPNTTTADTFEATSVAFPDGAVWTRVSPVTITYTGPQGPNEWTWSTHVDCSAAWLTVCTH